MEETTTVAKLQPGVGGWDSKMGLCDLRRLIADLLLMPQLRVIRIACIRDFVHGIAMK